MEISPKIRRIILGKPDYIDPEINPENYAATPEAEKLLTKFIACPPNVKIKSIFTLSFSANTATRDEDEKKINKVLIDSGLTVDSVRGDIGVATVRGTVGQLVAALETGLFYSIERSKITAVKLPQDSMLLERLNNKDLAKTDIPVNFKLSENVEQKPFMEALITAAPNFRVVQMDERNKILIGLGVPEDIKEILMLDGVETAVLNPYSIQPKASSMSMAGV